MSKLLTPQVYVTRLGVDGDNGVVYVSAGTSWMLKHSAAIIGTNYHELGGGVVRLMKRGFDLGTGFISLLQYFVAVDSLALPSHITFRSSLGHFFSCFSNGVSPSLFFWYLELLPGPTRAG
jgi:hypothetical protein